MITACITAANADFTVRRNLNDGKPREAAFVLFEKGGGTKHLQLAANGKTTEMGISEDGSLVIDITEHSESTPTITWKATDSIPPKLNASDYAGVLIRYKFEGTQAVTWKGKKGPPRKISNPWLIFMLYDDKGERTSAINLAYMQPNDSLPTEMQDVFIPMSLFIQNAYNDLSSLTALGFKLPGTRSTRERDFRITIERIALIR